MPSYELIQYPLVKQDETSLSHIGGSPNLPDQFKLPNCKLCNSPMTFFFQVKFPKKHDWAGKIMSVFACTSCTPIEGNHYPPFSPNRKRIPDHFLDDYEKSFHIFAFENTETSSLRKEYKQVLQFEKIELQSLRSTTMQITRIGGKPNWRISNDFPEDYMGSHFTFLMQIWDDWAFKKLPNAPRQALFSFLDSSVKFRNDDLYFLFRGAPLYLFGTLDFEIPKVYVLNQK